MLCEAKEVDAEEHSYLAAHRSHDVGLLLKRWYLVARKADLRVVDLERGEPHPVVALHNRHSVSGKGLYLSAGIHGDEPAAVQGLLEWAEKNVQLLRGRPVTILPCLNPWGLENNRREDAEGRDLNRSFDCPEVPVIGSMLELLSERKFAVAISLHEDFDANGVYVYELACQGESLGSGLLEQVEEIIPRHRGKVDGRKPRHGVIRRTRGLTGIAKEIGGMPESIHLFLSGARTALTFETPSEYSLYRRVQCHVRFLEGVADLTRPGSRGC
ncbi:MAG: M14 family metallocarboxypeptidase [Roseibacillus sp.]|nr:M14 family metallocarboxypeptidase [Roseibacillus sp.]